MHQKVLEKYKGKGCVPSPKRTRENRQDFGCNEIFISDNSKKCNNNLKRVISLLQDHLYNPIAKQTDLSRRGLPIRPMKRSLSDLTNVSKVKKVKKPNGLPSPSTDIIDKRSIKNKNWTKINREFPIEVIKENPLELPKERVCRRLRSQSTYISRNIENNTAFDANINGSVQNISPDIPTIQEDKFIFKKPFPVTDRSTKSKFFLRPRTNSVCFNTYITEESSNRSTKTNNFKSSRGNSICNNANIEELPKNSEPKKEKGDVLPHSTKFKKYNTSLSPSGRSDLINELSIENKNGNELKLEEVKTRVGRRLRSQSTYISRNLVNNINCDDNKSEVKKNISPGILTFAETKEKRNRSVDKINKLAGLISERSTENINGSELKLEEVKTSVSPRLRSQSTYISRNLVNNINCNDNNSEVKNNMSPDILTFQDTKEKRNRSIEKISKLADLVSKCSIENKNGNKLKMGEVKTIAGRRLRSHSTYISRNLVNNINCNDINSEVKNNMSPDILTFQDTKEKRNRSIDEINKSADLTSGRSIENKNGNELKLEEVKTSVSPSLRSQSTYISRNLVNNVNCDDNNSEVKNNMSPEILTFQDTKEKRNRSIDKIKKLADLVSECSIENKNGNKLKMGEVKTIVGRRLRSQSTYISRNLVNNINCNDINSEIKNNMSSDILTFLNTKEKRNRSIDKINKSEDLTSERSIENKNGNELKLEEVKTSGSPRLRSQSTYISKNLVNNINCDDNNSEVKNNMSPEILTFQETKEKRNRSIDKINKSADLTSERSIENKNGNELNCDDNNSEVKNDILTFQGTEAKCDRSTNKIRIPIHSNKSSYTSVLSEGSSPIFNVFSENTAKKNGISTLAASSQYEMEVAKPSNIRKNILRRMSMQATHPLFKAGLEDISNKPGDMPIKNRKAPDDVKKPETLLLPSTMNTSHNRHSATKSQQENLINNLTPSSRGELGIINKFDTQKKIVSSCYQTPVFIREIDDIKRNAFLVNIQDNKKNNNGHISIMDKKREIDRSNVHIPKMVPIPTQIEVSCVVTDNHIDSTKINKYSNPLSTSKNINIGINSSSPVNFEISDSSHQSKAQKNVDDQIKHIPENRDMPITSGSSSVYNILSEKNNENTEKEIQNGISNLAASSKYAMLKVKSYIRKNIQRRMSVHPIYSVFKAGLEGISNEPVHMQMQQSPPIAPNAGGMPTTTTKVNEYSNPLSNLKNINIGINSSTPVNCEISDSTHQSKSQKNIDQMKHKPENRDMPITSYSSPVYNILSPANNENTEKEIQHGILNLEASSKYEIGKAIPSNIRKNISKQLGDMPIKDRETPDDARKSAMVLFPSRMNTSAHNRHSATKSQQENLINNSTTSSRREQGIINKFDTQMKTVSNCYQTPVFVREIDDIKRNTFLENRKSNNGNIAILDKQRKIDRSNVYKRKMTPIPTQIEVSCAATDNNIAITKVNEYLNPLSNLKNINIEINSSTPMNCEISDSTHQSKVQKNIDNQIKHKPQNRDMPITSCSLPVYNILSSKNNENTEKEMQHGISILAASSKYEMGKANPSYVRKNIQRRMSVHPIYPVFKSGLEGISNPPVYMQIKQSSPIAPNAGGMSTTTSKVYEYSNPFSNLKNINIGINSSTPVNCEISHQSKVPKNIDDQIKHKPQNRDMPITSCSSPVYNILSSKNNENTEKEIQHGISILAASSKYEKGKANPSYVRKNIQRRMSVHPIYPVFKSGLEGFSNPPVYMQMKQSSPIAPNAGGMSTTTSKVNEYSNPLSNLKNINIGTNSSTPVNCEISDNTHQSKAQTNIDDQIKHKPKNRDMPITSCSLPVYNILSSKNNENTEKEMQHGISILAASSKYEIGKANPSYVRKNIQRRMSVHPIYPVFKSGLEGISNPPVYMQIKQSSPIALNAGGMSTTTSKVNEYSNPLSNLKNINIGINSSTPVNCEISDSTHQSKSQKNIDDQIKHKPQNRDMPITSCTLPVYNILGSKNNENTDKEMQHGISILGSSSKCEIGKVIPFNIRKNIQRRMSVQPIHPLFKAELEGISNQPLHIQIQHTPNAGGIPTASTKINEYTNPLPNLKNINKRNNSSTPINCEVSKRTYQSNGQSHTLIRMPPEAVANEFKAKENSITKNCMSEPLQVEQLISSQDGISFYVSNIPCSEFLLYAGDPKSVL